MTGSQSDGKPARLGWWPEVRARSGDRQPLTRDQIVAAAIKLIDAEGLAGFTMRRLGGALGAGATSLYWHVKDKDQLIDLVLDEAALELRLDDDAAARWRDRLAGLAREIRAGMKRHPTSHHSTVLAFPPVRTRFGSWSICCRCCGQVNSRARS